jgi:F-type H+-transporting ATPase subunit gamma
MEAVSAVKMRKSQEAALRGRPYAVTAAAILSQLLQGTVEQHPLMKERGGKRTLYIVITSDRGLAGSFNVRVLRAVEKDIELKGLSKGDIGVIACGKKGYEYFSRRGFEMEKECVSVGDIVLQEVVREMVQAATERFLMGAYDCVALAYTNFKSTLTQEALVHDLLPLKVNVFEAMVDDILPEKGKYSREFRTKAPPQYTIEPSPEEVLHILIPKLVSILVFHAFLESKASEHSSRMIAMKSASDKSKDMAKHLNLLYNKLRQAGITREVSEIIGGREALAQ